VPRFRLRYQATDLEMAIGSFLIGRSSACSLALDDALVSRRHAILHVSEDGVVLEDLGSRNGVQVNGQRVTGKNRVRHLDRLTIGSQEMVLIEVGKKLRDGERPTGEYTSCARCKAPIAPGELRCGSCGQPVVSAATTLSGATLELPIGGFQAAPEEEETRQADAFVLIASIAEKALAMGRGEEAERMAAQHLEGILRDAEDGDTIPDEHVELASRIALLLSEALGRTSWISYVFRLHGATRRIIAGPSIDRLYELVRRVRYTDSRTLRAYLDTLQHRSGQLTPADRFLVKRLEGLERVITA
jgi:hypothetical protein